MLAQNQIRRSSGRYIPLREAAPDVAECATDDGPPPSHGGGGKRETNKAEYDASSLNKKKKGWRAIRHKKKKAAACCIIFPVFIILLILTLILRFSFVSHGIMSHTGAMYDAHHHPHATRRFHHLSLSGPFFANSATLRNVTVIGSDYTVKANQYGFRNGTMIEADHISATLSVWKMLQLKLHIEPAVIEGGRVTPLYVDARNRTIAACEALRLYQDEASGKMDWAALKRDMDTRDAPPYEPDAADRAPPTKRDLEYIPWPTEGMQGVVVTEAAFRNISVEIACGNSASNVTVVPFDGAGEFVAAPHGDTIDVDMQLSAPWSERLHAALLALFEKTNIEKDVSKVQVDVRVHAVKETRKIEVAAVATAPVGRADIEAEGSWDAVYTWLSRNGTYAGDLVSGRKRWRPAPETPKSQVLASQVVHITGPEKGRTRFLKKESLAFATTPRAVCEQTMRTAVGGRDTRVAPVSHQVDLIQPLNIKADVRADVAFIDAALRYLKVPDMNTTHSNRPTHVLRHAYLNSVHVDASLGLDGLAVVHDLHVANAAQIVDGSAVYVPYDKYASSAHLQFDGFLRGLVQVDDLQGGLRLAVDAVDIGGMGETTLALGADLEGDVGTGRLKVTNLAACTGGVPAVYGSATLDLKTGHVETELHGKDLVDIATKINMKNFEIEDIDVSVAAKPDSTYFSKKVALHEARAELAWQRVRKNPEFKVLARGVHVNDGTLAPYNISFSVDSALLDDDKGVFDVGVTIEDRQTGNVLIQANTHTRFLLRRNQLHMPQAVQTETDVMISLPVVSQRATVSSVKKIDLDVVLFKYMSVLPQLAMKGALVANTRMANGVVDIDYLHQVADDATSRARHKLALNARMEEPGTGNPGRARGSLSVDTGMVDSSTWTMAGRVPPLTWLLRTHGLAHLAASSNDWGPLKSLVISGDTLVTPYLEHASISLSMGHLYAHGNLTALPSPRTLLAYDLALVATRAQLEGEATQDVRAWVSAMQRGGSGDGIVSENRVQGRCQPREAWRQLAEFWKK